MRVEGRWARKRSCEDDRIEEVELKRKSEDVSIEDCESKGFVDVDVVMAFQSRSQVNIDKQKPYNNAAAITIITPALPAYIAFKLDAAPIKFSGITVADAVADLDADSAEDRRLVDVGVAKVEVLFNVEVTDATTSETVMVRVRVAVEVRVVVSSARARRGRRAYAKVVKRILADFLELIAKLRQKRLWVVDSKLMFIDWQIDRG